jgi:adhesin/invasin
VAGNVITATNLVWLNASGSTPDASHNLGGIVIKNISAESAVYDNRVSGVSNAQGHRPDAAGIVLDNNAAQITLDTNLVQGCVGHGIRITATGYPGGSPLSMHGNSVYANRGFGIYSLCAAATAAAEGNWWGHNSPTTSANPADLGFDVYAGAGADVDYTPVISLTLTAAPTSIPANGTATSTITATASGGGYYILDGTLITFTSNLSTLVYPGTGVFGAGRSNAILRAGTVAGVATITGTAEPGVEGQSTTVILTALDPNSISLMAEPTSVMVDVYKQALVTATVHDIYGNPVPGRTVAFSCNVLGAVAPGSGATDALGQAGTKFTAATTTPGIGVVTATVGGVLSTSISIPITAGPVCTSSMTIAASPATIVGNGVSTSTITVNMTDCFGNRVVNGTMVRFNTTLGTILDYQYVEAEDAAVSKSPEWSVLPDGTASGGFYISTGTPGAAAFWDFRGGAVSLTFWRSGGGGVMQVRIDGGAPFMVSTTGAPAAWTEWVMASGLDPAVTHRIEVTYVSGLIELDVFRSGASSVGGRATAILRSPVLNVTNTATVYATERIGDPLWPPLPVNTTVTFSPANVVWVDDDYCPLCANDGHVWGNDAFSNIPAGVTAVRRPGTVMVLTGTYTLPVDITIGNVNLLGAGAPAVIVDGGGLPNPAMAIWAVNNVVIRDFTFANWGSGVNIPGPASYLEVSNSVFTNCVTLGISGVRVNSSLFANNTIEHSDGGGIELDTLSGVTLRDNHIHDISGTGIHIFSSVAVPCIGNEISHNTIERLGASGINAGTNCSNTLVLSNTVRSTNRTATGGGIVLDSTTDSTVNYNIVTEVSNAGASTDTAGIRIDGTNAGGEIHHNRVLANVNDGVACLSYNTPPTVTCNHIYGNGHYGLVNNFGTVVNARGNWWGTNSPTGGPPAPADIGFIVPLNVDWSSPITLAITAAATSVPAGGAPIVVTATGSGGGCGMVESMPVTFTTNLGGLGTPPTTTVLMAMSGGQASTLFTPGTHAGIATITATVPNMGSASVTVEVKPGLPASIALEADPALIAVGTGPGSQSALSAYVWDMYGNPVVNGTQVSFTTSLGSITPTMNTTTGGMAASTLYAGTVPGIATVSARWDGSFVVDSTDVEITAGPPFVISSLTADPTAILSNGIDTSQITAVVRDQYGNYVPDGTMVAFYTTAGSLIYDTVEAESASVIHTDWATVPDGTASGGACIQTSTVGAEARWDFHGEAVSVGYWQSATGGVMDVVVDGVPVKTVNTIGAPTWTEVMLANGLDSTALHRVEIFCTSGTIIIDYLRSGATTTSGHAVAVLTSGTTPITAHVTATGIGGTFPQAAVDVQFLEPLEVWVDDNWTPTSSGGHLWGFDAFSNIPAAVTRVRSGGTVHVADGVYTQTIEISKPLHLDGAGSSSTTHLVGPGTGDGIHVFWPADGTTIEGFAIMSFTHGVNLTGLASDYLQGVTVTNMVIERCGAPGAGGAITATYVNNGYFADNALHNDNGYGFDLDTGNNNILRNNHIYDNNGFGVRIMSGALASDNNQVLENNLYDLAWDGVRIGLGSSNTQVLTNTIHNTNRTWSPSGQFDMGGVGLYATINTRVEDNTIYDVQNGGGALLSTAGVALDGSNNGAVIQNNRLLSNRNHGIWIHTDGYPGASVPEIHGNSIYGNLGYGIMNNVPPAVGVANAQGNWWGRNVPTTGVVGPADIFSGWGANVTYTPPIQLILTRSPTQIVADGISTALITATMRTTAPDYKVLDGTMVTFTTNLGSLGAPAVVRSMLNGVANVVLQSDTVSGRSYITGTTPSAGMDWTWVDFVAGPPANIEITASPAALWAWGCTPVGYPHTSTINVTVTDQYGNPCAGQNVTYTLTSGMGAALSWYTGILDVLGTHLTTLASGNIAGTLQVTVTAGSISHAVPVVVMSGPPTDVSVARSPEAIAADGVSTSTLSATVRDNCGSAGVGNLIYDGTMVGFVTSHGTLPYGYVEAEATLPSLHISAPSDWSTVANPNASGLAYLHTSHSGAWVSWQFTGTAVSFIYPRYPTGGQVRVYVDDVLRKTLSEAAGPPDEWLRETVIANDLTFGPHTLKVEASTLAPGQSIAVDAFRSGATTLNGVATAILTSEPISATAYITATAVDSRLEALDGLLLPYGATTVRFERANLAIQKTASANVLPSGVTVNYTLTYTNTGIAQATNTLITDTLPVSLTYVSSTSSPFVGLPTNPITNVWVWNAGNVPHMGTGMVTVVARRVCAPGLGVITNTATIGSLTLPESTANASSSVTATLTFGTPYTVTLRSVPANIATDSFSTVFITVTDGCGEPVPSATVYLTTNVGTFDTYPGPTNTVRTTDPTGQASVSYWGGPVCGLATINATSGAAQGVLHISIGAGLMAHSVVMADPPAIPADGLSTSAISAQILDTGMCIVPDGTLVGFTTTAGSVLYGYAENDSPLLHQSPPGTWATWSDPLASGGTYIDTSLDGAALYWNMVGNGVSVVYLQVPGAGIADVDLDGVPLGEIDMNSITTTVHLAEKVYTWSGSPTENHIVSVRRRPGSAGPVNVDALRSGRTTLGGMAVALLTSTTTPMTATVYATAISETTGIPLRVPGHVNVAFGATDMGITKAVQPAVQVTIGQRVTYTLTYRNYGLVTATVAYVDDVLSVDALRNLFFSEPPFTVTNYVHYYWPLGNVPPGASRTITFGGTIDTSHYWPSATVLANTAVVGSNTLDPVGANNTAVVTTTIVPGRPASLSLSPSPAAIPVGGSISTLTALVRDSYGNPVPNGTPVTFTTTLGGFPFSSQFVGSTSGGAAVASLASSNNVGTANILAAVDGLTATTQVVFYPLPPFTMTLTAAPPQIFVGGETSVIDAWVVDQYGNWVYDGTAVQFATSAGAIGPASAGTISGHTSAVLTSGNTALTATVTVTASPVSRTVQVVFRPGTPRVTMTARPATLKVGETSVVTLTARDEFNNPLVGEPVTFTTDLGDFGSGYMTVTVGTDLTGRAWVGLRSTLIGQALVRGKIRTESGAVVVTFGPGDPYTITLNVDPGTIVGCGGTALARAEVKDRYGNHVRDGTVVVFDVAPQGEVRPIDGGRTTDGVATAWVVSGAVPGPATVWAWPENWRSQVVAQFPLDFLVGPADSIELTAVPTSLSVGHERGVIKLHAIDCGGYPVANGTPVSFTITTGEGSLSPQFTTTTNGWAYSDLTSPDETGSATIRASIDGREASVVVVYDPGPVYNVEVDAVPALIAANGVSTATITAKLRDRWGNYVADRTELIFTTDLGSFSGSLSFRTSTRGGLASAILTAGLTPGRGHVAATANNGRRGETYIDLFSAPTPTPTPTPGWKIGLPIIMKYRYR